MGTNKISDKLIEAQSNVFLLLFFPCFTVSVAAECDLRLWCSQLEVEVSCQIFDPD